MEQQAFICFKQVLSINVAFYISIELSIYLSIQKQEDGTTGIHLLQTGIVLSMYLPFTTKVSLKAVSTDMVLHKSSNGSREGF